MGQDHGTFEHTADMGIWGRGSTPGEAILSAARAMFELSSGGGAPGLVDLREVRVSCEGDSLVELLVETLNEMLSVADLEGLEVAEVVALLEEEGPPHKLEAALVGAAYDGAGGRERLREVKAATYHLAGVERLDDGGWEARCVVDL